MAPWVLATAALTTAWWVAFVFAPGRRATVGSADLRVWYLPVYDAFYRRVAAGDLPVWNPYQLGGLPWLALLAGGFFYPPHVLYLVLPTHLALAASGLLHLVLVAVSTALFARRAGFGAAAAFLAAVLFTCRGSIPLWLLQPLLLEAVSWLPLGCVGALGLARGEGRRAVALLALAAGASFLSGGLQVTVFLFYAWGTLFVVLVLGARPAPVAAAAASGGFAIALALGVLAAAVQIWPTLELSGLGTRATESLDLEKMFPIGYPGFALLGEAISGARPSFAVVGLVLVVAAVFGGRPRALVLWASGVGVVTFAISLGPVTPLFDVNLVLPGLGWFRTPQRIFVVTDFCFAILAAAGLEAVVAGAGRRRVALACAFVLVVSLTIQRSPGPALFAAAVATLLFAGSGGRVPLAAGLVALATVEVFVPRAHPERLPYDASAAAMGDEFRDVYLKLAEAQGPDRVWVISSGVAPGFSPKLPSRFRLRAIDDYESMNLRRQAEYFTYAMFGSADPAASRVAFVGRVMPVPSVGGPPLLVRHRRLLDLLALRLVAVPQAMLLNAGVRTFVADAGLEPRPSPRPPVLLYENPRALPRAFVVYRAQTAPPTEELLRRLADPRFDPFAVSYVEGDPGIVPPAGAPSRGEAATFVRDEERVVEVDARLAAPGLVVLADAVYPGWRATVDGVPAPILTVNHLFRGVRAGPGTHRVRFEYWPGRTVAGAVVSALAAALIAGLWFGSRGRS